MEIKQLAKIKDRLEKLDKIQIKINKKLNDRQSIAVSNPNGKIVKLYDRFFLVEFKGIRECFTYVDILVVDIEVHPRGNRRC